MTAGMRVLSFSISPASCKSFSLGFKDEVMISSMILISLIIKFYILNYGAKVPVPGEGHEYVAASQQQRGEVICLQIKL